MEFFNEEKEEYSDILKEDCETFSDDNNIHCGACGKDLEEAALDSELFKNLSEITGEMKDDENLATVLFSDTLDNDEKLRELKIFMKMQEQGLSIDYRCAACRSCPRN